MLALSFILPCYNVGRYIGDCLDSIYAQNLSEDEFEVICVDDCSIDDTVDVIKDYQKKHTNIVLHCHEVNQTAGGARNTGMKLAKGEYIWFVDPDDMLPDDVVTDLLKRADREKLDIALFNFMTTTEFSGVIREAEKFYEDSEVCDGYTFLDNYQKKNIGKNSIIWLQLYRTSFLKSNPDIVYPCIRVSQDGVFSWKAFFNAKRVQSEAKPRYIYRCNGGSTTASYKTEKKVFASSILAPYTYLEWFIKNDAVRDDYKQELLRCLKWDLNRLVPLYKNLELGERSKLFYHLRDSMELKVLYPYMGRKMRIALKLGLNNFKLMDLLIKWMKL